MAPGRNGGSGTRCSRPIVTSVRRFRSARRMQCRRAVFIQKTVPQSQRKRDEPMIDANQIKPRMPVVCSLRTQFATVERVEGRMLKLAKDDRGQHHYIPLDWVRSVDDKVHID